MVARTWLNDVMSSTEDIHEAADPDDDEADEADEAPAPAAADAPQPPSTSGAARFAALFKRPSLAAVVVALAAIVLASRAMPGENADKVAAARVRLAAATLYSKAAGEQLVGDGGMLPAYNVEHRANVPPGENPASSAVGYARITANGGVKLFSGLQGINIARISKHWTVLLFPVYLLMMLTFGAVSSPEARDGGGKWAHTLSVVASYLRGPGSHLAMSLGLEYIDFLIFDSVSFVNPPYHLLDVSGLLPSWVPAANRSASLIRRVFGAATLAGTSMLVATRPFASHLTGLLFDILLALVPNKVFESVVLGALHMREVLHPGEQRDQSSHLVDSYHPSAGAPAMSLAWRNNIVWSLIYGGSPLGVFPAPVPPIVAQLGDLDALDTIVESIDAALGKASLKDFTDLAFAVRGDGGAGMRKEFTSKNVPGEVARGAARGRARRGARDRPRLPEAATPGCSAAAEAAQRAKARDAAQEREEEEQAAAEAESSCAAAAEARADGGRARVPACRARCRGRRGGRRRGVRARRAVTASPGRDPCRAARRLGGARPAGRAAARRLPKGAAAKVTTRRGNRSARPLRGRRWGPPMSCAVHSQRSAMSARTLTHRKAVSISEPQGARAPPRAALARL